MNRFDNTEAAHKLPKNIVKGDLVSWRNSSLVPEYPVDTYTLRYSFRREGSPALEFAVDSQVDSAEYLFEVDSATTADYETGLYHWQLYIVRISDSERVTHDDGILAVLANRDTDSEDPRSLPRRMIAEIERAMLHRAENTQIDVTSYSNPETSSSRDYDRLRVERTHWKRELVIAIRKYRSSKGLPHSGRIRLLF